VHNERAAPVALKLALNPADLRFAREAELLSRCTHPSLPRLVEQGMWRSAWNTEHPYLVMEWVEGAGLYEQARLHPPAAGRVRRWLAQLAQALAHLHAQGAVHRDLKGGNILVRGSDDRAMLMDLGSGVYPSAESLTPAMGFPGTSLYRSPEAWLFEIEFYGSDTERYEPSAADDVYALGVTFCRLLTGEYPELCEPYQDERGRWRWKGVRLPRGLLKSPDVEPALRPILQRLLSVNPEQRGTAAQLARELEPVSLRRHFWTRVPWRQAWLGLPVAAAGLALVVGAGWTVFDAPRERPAVARVEPAKRDSADAGTTGLGETATLTARDMVSSGSPAEGMIEDPLPEPQPGQARPDEKGRCPPSKGLVALNGGCWIETALDAERCLELGVQGQMFKGTCYVPFMPSGRKRPPTSGSLQNP
jgi:hypothetical protein